MAVRRSTAATVYTATDAGHVLLALFGLTPEPWPGRALCADHEPETWFPNCTSGRAPERRMAVAAEPAKAVCARCPVREECLMGALERDERHGVWGGLDEFERRALKTRRPTRRALEAP